MQEHRGMSTAQLPLNVKKRFLRVRKEHGGHGGMCLEKTV